jgi:hypothetical protein
MVGKPNYPISRIFKERAGEARDIERRMAGDTTSMRETTAHTREVIANTRDMIAEANRLLQQRI